MTTTDTGLTATTDLDEAASTPLTARFANLVDVMRAGQPAGYITPLIERTYVELNGGLKPSNAQLDQMTQRVLDPTGNDRLPKSRDHETFGLALSYLADVYAALAADDTRGETALKLFILAITGRKSTRPAQRAALALFPELSDPPGSDGGMNASLDAA